MKLCDICHKNVAIIYTAKIENGKTKMIGLCTECAKKLGVPAVNKIMEQSGMSSEDAELLTEQMNDILKDVNLKDVKSMLENTDELKDNKFISNFMENIFKSPEDISELDIENPYKDTKEDKIKDKKNKKRRKYLESYGINLTDKARNNEIDRVIGRNEEIERVIQILNRRTKNNPVLIGEPGVGKTAIAEGLAMKIIDKKVPLKLIDKEIYLLDLTALVAGTQFRGQFENRMKNLINEVKEDGNIILVIDEIHNIVGVGDINGGAMNAANILKPALAKGELQIIGATTISEYRRVIEKDTALERRFQPIIVEEPSIKDTIEILKGIRIYYEKYHNVIISDEVIKAAVNMSSRYITDRFLPDKAIDVIDEASSRANLKNDELLKLKLKKKELTALQEKIRIASNNEDYKKAAEYKTNECKLENDIKLLEGNCNKFKITVEDVAHIIELWTKIPVHTITEKETEKLLKLEQRLHTKIIGQDKAVISLSKAIRRNRLGFSKKKKPASFIFVGPTGVGKTELVKALSSELFGSEDSLIRIDMSEYMEKHTASKLIGSPPGYIGYDEGGQLTDKVRKNPYSVILFDEIEKAHPDIFNMLLQILDDGRLTDSQGRTVYFNNTVIIMTSNVGTDFKNNGIGFAQEEYDMLENKVRESLKEHFKPEFLNRVDEILVFKHLTISELEKIIELMLKEVNEELSEKGISMEISSDVKKFLIEKGYDKKYGARPLRRVIQRYIEDELTEQYLQGSIDNNSNIKLILEKNEIKVVKK